jgi:hypothetical protein
MLAEPIPWKRFLGSLNVGKFGLWNSRVGYGYVSMFNIPSPGTGIGKIFKCQAL